MKTTKEIADIAGVSKMTVYRHIKKCGVTGSQQSNNTMLYDDTAVNTIMKSLGIDYGVTEVNTPVTPNLDYNSVILSYQEQLKAKDSQLENMQKLLDQQQQLSLQDKNQVNELKERISELEGLIVAPNEFQEDTDINTPEEPKTAENVNDSSKNRKWFQFWKKEM